MWYGVDRQNQALDVPFGALLSDLAVSDRSKAFPRGWPSKDKQYQRLALYSSHTPAALSAFVLALPCTLIA